jgi:hypothetical protein
MVALLYILFAMSAMLAIAPPRGEIPRRVIYAGFGVVLFLLAGLRPESSVSDYSNYLGMYEGIVNGGRINFYLEPSFSVIVLFVERCFGDPLFMFIIYAALGVWLKMTAIKRISELWFLSLVFYFATFFLQHEMVQIRAGVATGFILMAIKPLYERKPGPYLLLMACAVLFHYSALAFLPVWFLPRHRRYNRFLWGVIPFGALLYLTNVNLLSIVSFPFPAVQTRLQAHIDVQQAGVFETVPVFGAIHLMRTTLYYLLLCFHSRILKHNRYVTLLLYIYATGLFMGLAFGSIPVIAGRLGDIFVVVEIVLVPMLVYAVRPRTAGRCVVAAVAICHLLLALAFGQRLVT